MNLCSSAANFKKAAWCKIFVLKLFFKQIKLINKYFTYFEKYRVYNIQLFAV